MADDKHRCRKLQVALLQSALVRLAAALGGERGGPQ